MSRCFVILGSTLAILAFLVQFPLQADDDSVSWTDADDALIDKGTTAHEDGDFKTEEAIYRKLRDQHPNSAEALLYHVEGLVDLKRYPEALEESRKAAAIKPDYALAYEWSGISLEYLGQHDAAIADLKKSRELEPDEATASSWLIAACINSGDQKQADQLVDQLLKGQGKEYRPAVYSGIADVFHQMGDDASAIIWWRKAAALGDSGAASYLSWVYSYGNVPTDAGENAYWDRVANDTYAWFPRLSIADEVITGSQGWVLVIVAIFSAAILPLLTIGIVAVFLGRGLTTDPEIHWTERARRSYPIQVTMGVSVLLPFIYVLGVNFYPGSMLPFPKWILGLIVFLVGAASTNFISVVLAGRYREHPDSYFRNFQNVAALLFLYGPTPSVFVIMMWCLPSQWGLQAALTILAACLVYFWIQFGGWTRLGRILFLLYPAEPELTEMVGALAREYGHPTPTVWMFRWGKANAFAFVFSNAIAVTEKLLEVLSPAETKAIMAHELAHLREKRSTRLMLFFAPLVCLPIFTISLWSDSVSWYAPLILLFVLLLAVLVLRRVRRRMEVTADAFGKKAEGEDGAYPRALARLYENNLVPAVMPGKRKVHPHLYDRLLASGITPEYPRPKAPSRWGSLASLFVLFSNILALMTLWLLLF